MATARTPATVAPILERVDMRLPAIVMTGAALWDTRTRRYSRVVYMDPQAAGELVEVYRATQTPTFLYTLVDDMIHILSLSGPFPNSEDFLSTSASETGSRCCISPRTEIPYSRRGSTMWFFSARDAARPQGKGRRMNGSAVGNPTAILS